MQSDRYLLLKVRELFGASVSIREKHGIGGGCINRTSALVLDHGPKIFLKENSISYVDLFKAEAVGLEALSTEGGPAVPKPYGYGAGAGRQFLLIEFVESGRKNPDFWEEFGRRLAFLHKVRNNVRFGFEIDNYIGASPQPNQWEESWPRFFGHRRLGFQLSLVRKEGHSSEGWVQGVERLIGRIEQLLPQPNHASLLHGDLWGGNFMVGADGRAVLIDPAVYYGHREADLAMTELFGGFGPRFYAAYNEILPLDPGYEDRKDLYNLYHLLNHFNLFGGSYSGSIASIVKRYS